MTEEELEKYYEEFYVPGAGKIRISIDPSYKTGDAIGFTFGVEWGRNGYTGGVLDKKEAIRLARHILRNANLEELLS